MPFEQIDIDSHKIIYDDSLPSTPSLDLFSPQNNQQVTDTNTLGRTTAITFSLEGIEVVLKRYRRGGFIGQYIKQSYVFLGTKKTRMYQELHLLAEMKKCFLPVPKPIAIHIERKGLLYQGDLITEKIPQAKTLAEHLFQAPISQSQWKQLGIIIQRFHKAKVFHADLNANNIMFDAMENFHLIDFDKSYIKLTESASWKEKNLERLLRSLSKYSSSNTTFHFHPSNWKTFLSGYNA